MTQEIYILLTILLLLFLLSAVQIVMTMTNYGSLSVLGPRDDIPFIQPGMTGRLQRAIHNLRESLHIFTPLILLTAILSINNENTVLGAQVYLVGRVLHPLLYLSGIKSLRTLAYFIGVIGCIFIVMGLLEG